MMRTHLNLATTDIAKSVGFYSVLLDAQPMKVLDDYALFVTDEPPLELALDRHTSVIPAEDVHFGVCVDSADDVERALNRLEKAGLVTSVEREEICCYANQTKVWTSDPEGRRWEVYTVHEDTESRDGDAACCQDEQNASAVACACADATAR